MMSETVVAPRLQEGDRIRVIAPAMPLDYAIPHDFVRERIRRRFEEDLQLEVTFGAHVTSRHRMVPRLSVDDRITDLVDAFEDDSVKAIFSAWGGYDSNDILRRCEFDEKQADRVWGAVRHNPKIFCGASDNMLINNALLAKTGLISYYGINYGTFYSAAHDHYDFLRQSLRSCLMSDTYVVQHSDIWSDTVVDGRAGTREFRYNTGPLVFKQPPEAAYVTNQQPTPITLGRIAAGCMRNLTTHAATPYQLPMDHFPEGTILFLEDTGILSAEGAKRELTSLMLRPDWRSVKGLVFGRFAAGHYGAFAEKKLFPISHALAGDHALDRILNTFTEEGVFDHIQFIVTGFDLGHTEPSVMVPIGGWVAAAVAKGHERRRDRTEFVFSHYPFKEHDATDTSA